MKSKEQKRAEAIARAKISFASRGRHRFDSEEDYLDLFRPKSEIVQHEHNLIYDEKGHRRPAPAPTDDKYSIDHYRLLLTL